MIVFPCALTNKIVLSHFKLNMTMVTDRPLFS